MRRSSTLAMAGIALFLAVASPLHAVTMSQWATTPITLGDKVFTLISSTWASNDDVSVSSFSSYYMCTVGPASSLLSNTTKTLIYRVTIINDPVTPLDEALWLYFTQVSADGNRYIASGSFTVTGVFDDNSDFSSPLATFSNAGTPTGALPIAGTVKDLYVRLTTVATGSTILSSHTVAFLQVDEAVPTESSTWGQVKALYR